METEEIFFFWVSEGVQIYALPLSSHTDGNHPIFECLNAAHIHVVNDRTIIPRHLQREFCTVLINRDPTVREDGKIPIYRNSLCEVVTDKLQAFGAHLTDHWELFNFRTKIDEEALVVLSKLITPGEHLITVGEHEGIPVYDTLLNFAIDRSCTPLTQLILESGVDVNAETQRLRLGLLLAKDTALIRAIIMEARTTVELLLQYGADVELGGAICFGASKGNAEIVRWLLDRGAPINTRVEPNHRTPLHCSTDPKVTSLLLERGADVNAVSSNDFKTPLISQVAWFFSLPKVENVLILLEHNANVNARFLSPSCLGDDWSVWSNAATSAAYRGHIDIFNILIKFGACVEFKDLLAVPSVEEFSFTKDVNFFEHIHLLLDHTLTDFNPACKGEVSKQLEELFSVGQLSQQLTDVGLERLMSLRGKIATQIIKVEVAYCTACSGIPGVFREELVDLKKRCQKEVACLKVEKVGDTSVSFFEILTGTTESISRLLRNDSVATALEEEDVSTNFPIYGGVLKSQASKGSWRRRIISDGIKIFGFLFTQFPGLPWDVRERIINLLSNQDVLVLESCFNPEQLKAIAGPNNCHFSLKN